MSQLRKEFEPRHTQLFAHDYVSLIEALSEILAKETHLDDAGLLEIPSALLVELMLCHLLHQLLLALVLCSSYQLLVVRVTLVLIAATATEMVSLGLIALSSFTSDSFKQFYLRNKERNSSSEICVSTLTPSIVSLTKQDILGLSVCLPFKFFDGCCRFCD